MISGADTKRASLLRRAAAILALLVVLAAGVVAVFFPHDIRGFYEMGWPFRWQVKGADGAEVFKLGALIGDIALILLTACITVLLVTSIRRSSPEFEDFQW